MGSAPTVGRTTSAEHKNRQPQLDATLRDSAERRLFYTLNLKDYHYLLSLIEMLNTRTPSYRPADQQSAAPIPYFITSYFSV
jgi:hypothetical protein